jgi:hypothetical protein
MKKIFFTFLLLTAIAPGIALANTYSGQATVVQANVLGLQPITLADTGPLPPDGGQLDASLVDASVPGLLSVSVLHATTVGMGDASRSEASVANLALTVNGNNIGAGFLMSNANAFCPPAVSGSSNILELVINGQPIVVSGSPNQTIPLPTGGEVIINEQSQSVQGNHADITVTALHVIIPNIADVAISRAHADITCTGSSTCPSDKDFVTGGGRITTSTGGKATFGVAGGIKNGGFWGHLTYIDHGTGMKVKGTGVTKYVVTGATTRHIEGTCDVDGQSGSTYAIDVDDQGEPGRNDRFKMVLSPSGYTADNTLDGGNIQLHVCK